MWLKKNQPGSDLWGLCLRWAPGEALGCQQCPCVWIRSLENQGNSRGEIPRDERRTLEDTQVLIPTTEWVGFKHLPQPEEAMTDRINASHIRPIQPAMPSPPSSSIPTTEPSATLVGELAGRNEHVRWEVGAFHALLPNSELQVRGRDEKL